MGKGVFGPSFSWFWLPPMATWNQYLRKKTLTAGGSTITNWPMAGANRWQHPVFSSCGLPITERNRTYPANQYLGSLGKSARYPQDRILIKFCKFGHFCAYSAVVSLYVYIIRVYEQSADIWTKYLGTARKCQQQIDVSAKRESFAQRCSGVLKGLERDCIHRKESYTQQLPAFNSMCGTRRFKRNTVVDRIDRWGFSSLTGYWDRDGHKNASHTLPSSSVTQSRVSKVLTQGHFLQSKKPHKYIY